MFKSHFKRIVIELLNAILGYDFIFFLIGKINNKINIIESVFLVYPGNEKYAHAYAYPRRIAKAKWNPWLSGALLQNGKLSIMFSISATNSDFTNPSNIELLKSICVRMEKLRKLFRANRKTFAGILPGVLYCNRIIREAPEADLTARAVCQAIGMVKENEDLPVNVPVIVLGGKGFIGRRVVKKLSPNTPIFSIDSVTGQSFKDWPNELRGQPVIVVNITQNEALCDYVDAMWPGTIVINEVYPEPNEPTLKKLHENKCVCYHVVGVKAKAWPAFPEAYKGAIPCCAAWPSINLSSEIRKLTP